ncbi:MAG: BrnA antitoxin family protein [Alphaproteobacteria bacterium]|nr:BrnA antitoxin family protein [Alphaproteobacteria bacterium]
MGELPKNKKPVSVSRRRARKGEPVKTAVSIRLSPEVISFFKAKGPGWQTRIDKALRALVSAME